MLYQACTCVQYWARYNCQQSSSKIKAFPKVYQSEFDELHKECHLQRGIVLVSLRMIYPGRSNQVLATEQVLYLLVYIGEI
jgi:hypothetical protein